MLKNRPSAHLTIKYAGYVKFMRPSFQSSDDVFAYFNCDEEVRAKLLTYHRLLLKWQKAINLVSPMTLDTAWARHFADSMQVENYVPANASIYADLGCGGGFPGLVIAAMRPELSVHLVESDERKGQFMRTVIREAGIRNATVHTVRIEHAIDLFTPDFVTARALASLDKLCGYIMPWAVKNPDLSCCFMKGERSLEEIETATAQYDFVSHCADSVTDSSAKIVSLHGLKPRKP